MILQLDFVNINFLNKIFNSLIFILMLSAIYKTSNINKNIKKSYILVISVFFINIAFAFSEIIIVNYILNPIGPLALLFVNLIFGYQTILEVKFS